MFVAVTAATAIAPVLADKMAMPSVNITSPASGATVTSTNIPVTVTIKNFDLECVDAGKPGKPGRGHVHAMLDGMSMAQLTNVECGDTFTVSGVGIKPGKHNLTVMLASDDHMPASMPSTIKFNYEPTKSQPLPKPESVGQPTLSIISPQAGASVTRKFNVRVAITNLDSSCALEGKPNVIGYGHLHVFANQTGVTDQKPMNMKMEMPSSGMMGAEGSMKMESMVGMVSMPCATTIPVDLSTWRPGPARITVMLAGNDHMPLSAKPSSIVVNVK